LKVVQPVPLSHTQSVYRFNDQSGRPDQVNECYPDFSPVDMRMRKCKILGGVRSRVGDGMRFWIIAVLLLAAVIAQAGKSSDSTSERIAKVELTLKAEHDIYRMSDTLQMETRLSNSGSKDVYIWEEDMCWNPARGLSMRITTSAGKYVQSPALLDCLPPPPAAGDAYQFVKISPHTFYGHVHRFKVSDLVDRPGEYTLFATFNRFLSAHFIAETFPREPISKLWTTDIPTITSNRIHIRVRP